jgi:hypothetical protein
MSTGKANVTVLGGMFHGQVYTMPVEMTALSLSWTGETRDAVPHVIVIADNRERYALHPITGVAELEKINTAYARVSEAIKEAFNDRDGTERPAV